MSIPPRVPLIEYLPLSFPFSIHIFASYYCNFKCEYCVHSLSKEQLSAINFSKQMMPYSVFKKVVDDLKEAIAMPNAMIFAGHGEPLTNPEIVKMVQYAKIHDAAKRVEIVSNGSLLSNKLSDSLIAAGLDRLRISLQGLDENDYKRVCETEIDFNKFTSGLEYFFNNKQNSNLFVKIIDIALKNKTDAERFHSLFDAISDEAAIEYLFPFIEQIDHTGLGGELKNTKHGDDVAKHVDICAMPFYMMVILPNGNVTGCCAIEPPVIFGNVMESNLLDIWKSNKRLEFLKTQISNRFTNVLCAKCTVPDYGMQREDYLDNHRERLHAIFERMK